jgi:Domain of unknown function (DU1801)
MAEPKTRPTDASVDEFLDSVANERRRSDARLVDGMMRAATGELPVMWGTSIVGYGAINYEGSRGKQATWPVVAFSPRKTELVLYLNTQIEPTAFEPLGQHRRGVGCLYIRRLDDIDRGVLDELIRRSITLADR